MRATAIGLFAVALAILTVPPAPVFAGAGFSFSEEERKDEERHEKARERAVAEANVDLGASCRAALAARRTVIIVAERSSAGFRTQQQTYGSHFGVLSDGLRRLGVRVYTQEEIQAQIAQAEIDAYFRNDSLAMLAAAKKLGPDLVLRGAISSRSVYNEFMGLPEVHAGIALTLTDAGGRILASAEESAESYSGADTLGMALTLLRERAPAVLGRLYRGACRSLGRAVP